MDCVQHKGYAFRFDPGACRECKGYCCRGNSGNIWVAAEEIDRIAAFLSMSQVDLITTMLRPVDNRLSITERYRDGQYECIFFDGKERRCLIYPVRPSQCRLFPFWPYYLDRLEELVEECPGIVLPPEPTR